MMARVLLKLPEGWEERRLLTSHWEEFLERSHRPLCTSGRSSPSSHWPPERRTQGLVLLSSRRSQVMRTVEIWVMLTVTLQASITVQSSVTVKYRYSEKCGPEITTWNKDIISTRNIKSNNEWNETLKTLRGSLSLPQRWTLSASRCLCVSAPCFLMCSFLWNSASFRAALNTETEKTRSMKVRQQITYRQHRTSSDKHWEWKADSECSFFSKGQ